MLPKGTKRFYVNKLVGNWSKRGYAVIDRLDGDKVYEFMTYPTHREAHHIKDVLNTLVKSHRYAARAWPK